MTKRRDIKEVKLAAHGHWYDIYNAYCPGLHEALERTTHRTDHVDCPFANCGRPGKFRFKRNRPDNGACVCVCGSYSQLDVIMEANGLTLTEAADLVSHHLFGDGGPTKEDLAKARAQAKLAKLKRRTEEFETSAFLIKLINSVWSSGTDIFDPRNNQNAIHWLRSNGYLGDGTDIRFHAALKHQEFKTKHPTFSILIRNEEGRVCSMQHHYLNDSCTDYAFEISTEYKRQIPYPASLYPQCVSMRLSPVTDGVLGIAEGFRSATGANALHPHIPVWAVVSDHYVKAFQPPENLKQLYLFYDKDASEAGIKASDALADRLLEERPEIEVVYMEPPLPLGDKKSVDWFDAYRAWIEKALQTG